MDSSHHTGTGAVFCKVGAMIVECKYIESVFKNMALLVDTVGNKKVEGKIIHKHFIKVFG